MSSEHQPEPNKDRAGLGSLIGALAGLLQSPAIGPGELAQLRRLDADSPQQPAFWRLLVTHVSPDAAPGERAERAWAVILSGMARMSPRAHAYGRPLGAVLAETGYSEARFTRFLRAPRESLPDTLRRITAFLAHKGEPFDWTAVATLLLTTNLEKAEQVRRGMAADYYRALAHTVKEAPRE